MIWAEEVKEHLHNSRLVIRDSPGHTSMSLHREASKIGENYLLSGEFPVDGLRVAT